MDARDSALVRDVDAFTRQRAAADSFSGVVLLARHGKPLYVFTHGFADRETGAPNRMDTKFNLASLDKYFTRIAIRQLQAAGKLQVSDLVGRHLPDYPNARVRDEVTIAHLLGMRSGLGDFDNVDLRRYYANRMQLRTTDDFMALFATDSLLFAPGTRVEYSNAGYVVLGKIIERLSGQSYYDYVQRHVFDPAGMRNTGYFTLDQSVPNMAVGYTTSGSDSTGPGKTRRPNTSTLVYRGSSAGGGYSTAEDLLKLSTALSSHRLLNEAFTDSLRKWRKPTPPGEFDWDGWAGGSQGMNTVFYDHSTGHTLIVLSNYDPPSASIYRPTMWQNWLPKWLRGSIE